MAGEGARYRLKIVPDALPNHDATMIEVDVGVDEAWALEHASWTFGSLLLEKYVPEGFHLVGLERIRP